MHTPTRLKTGAFLVLLSSSIQAIEISAPEPAKPPFYQPDEIVLFGDSLSDSNGDSYGHAYSTYNLLLTLNGQEPDVVDGKYYPPMDISEIIGRRASIRNLELSFQLNSLEILRESEEKGLIGGFWGEIKAYLLGEVGEALGELARWVDKTEGKIDKATLSILTPLSEKLHDWQKGKPEESFSARFANSVRRQVDFIIQIVERDMEDMVLDFSEDQITRITAGLGDTIPLIPDPDYYVRGKWTAGPELDKVWIEYLIRMMSTPDHQVKLDNRAMAGSWTLCAPAKMEKLDVLATTASGLSEGAVMLFQGSLVPPCEGLIVKSYLNQRRNIYKREHGHFPEIDEKIINDKSLIVFFNGGNDLMNLWDKPGDIAQEHIHDIWNILSSGAKKVAVVTMPDIGQSPRFKGTKRGKKVSSLVQEYNEHLEFRLSILRGLFKGDNSYQLITIHGDQLFAELLKEDRWDVEHPLLDVAIPGVDPKEEREAVAEERGDFVTAELLENKSFDDNWVLEQKSPQEAVATNVLPNKTAFFADSVHPSAEAHYAIATKACKILASFNIPCNPEHYTYEQAKRDSTQNNPNLGPKKIEL